MHYHKWWHNDPYKKEMIEAKIKKILGNNYLNELKFINATAPKITMFYLQNLLEAYKRGGVRDE